jgi:hypothetical protein
VQHVVQQDVPGAAAARPDGVLCALGHGGRLEVEHEQRHRDGEHAVAERREAIKTAARLPGLEGTYAVALTAPVAYLQQSLDAAPAATAHLVPADSKEAGIASCHPVSCKHTRKSRSRPGPGRCRAESSAIAADRGAPARASPSLFACGSRSTQPLVESVARTASNGQDHRENFDAANEIWSGSAGTRPTWAPSSSHPEPATPKREC